MKTWLTHQFKLFRVYPNSPMQLLKTRGFWLELKRGERAQVRTEIVEFIASLVNLKFGHPTSYLCSEDNEIYKKACCKCRVVVLLIKPIVF